jgi:hypothetical protein
VITDTSPTLDWEAVLGAAQYQLQLDDNSNFGSPEIDLLGSAADYAPASPLSETTHYWRVRARDNVGNWGAWSSAWSFEVDTTPPDPPTLVSPTNGEVITDTTPTLTWTSSVGASGYRLKLDGIVTDVGNVTQVTVTAASKGTHVWTVSAYDTAGNISAAATTWSFEVDVVGPNSPTLVSPTNGALVSDTTPLLKWQPVLGADQYQSQVDDDGNFGSPEIDVIGSATDYTPANALSEGTHYWRVRAQDNVGNWSVWSNQWSFEIDATPPDPPVLVSPADGSKTEDVSPLFEWLSVTDDHLYRIQISESQVFTSTLFDETISNTFFVPSDSLADGTYYWRIQSRDVVGNWGGWSSTWTVEVDAQPELHIYLPLIVKRL